MICERCGNEIIKEFKVIEFQGKAIKDLQVQHIACNKCTDQVYKDILDNFSEDTVNNCIYIHNVIIVKGGEQL